MKIAVVIPVLDEAEQILDAIASVRAGEPSGRPAPSESPDPIETEILVVDAGSSDQTLPRARQAGVRVLSAARGRARQLEAGWRASSGDVIVFLHADTRLEPGWTAALREALADPGVVGGAFRLGFDDPRMTFRLVEWVVRLRVGLFALPYGDQAIFVRRSALEAMGGVPVAELMEDLDLVRAMKRRGRLAALAPVATTSARRYRLRGVASTLCRNAAALVGWWMGIERGRLAGWVSR